MKLITKMCFFALFVCFNMAILYPIGLLAQENNPKPDESAKHGLSVITPTKTTKQNDAPSLSIASDLFTVTENSPAGMQTVLFTITLSSPVANDLYLSCNVTAYGSVTPLADIYGQDLALPVPQCMPISSFPFNGILYILAGSTQTTFTLAISTVNDSLYEGIEHFEVRVYEDWSPTPQTDLVEAIAIGSIVDDDPLVISISNSADPEDGVLDPSLLPTEHVANMKLFMNGKPSEKITYTMLITAGTAVSGTDFRVDATQITIDPALEGTDYGWSYENQLYYVRHSIQLLHDGLIEPDETFTISLANPQRINIGNATAVITITNDDASLFFAKQVGIIEGNSGSTILQIPYTLSQAIPSPLDLQCVLIRLGSDGIEYGVAGYDDFNYEPDFFAYGTSCINSSERKLKIPVSVTSGFITLTVRGDVNHEFDEKFILKIRTSALDSFNNISTSITITNDDSAPTVSIGNAQLVEGNSGTTIMYFTVAFSNLPITTPAIMTYTLFSGSATKGVDFIDTSDVISPILTVAGDYTLIQTIGIPIAGDTGFEANETFTLTFGAVQNGCFEYIYNHPFPPQAIFNPAFCAPANAIVSSSTVTGTIINDDLRTLFLPNTRRNAVSGW